MLNDDRQNEYVNNWTNALKQQILDKVRKSAKKVSRTIWVDYKYTEINLTMQNEMDSRASLLSFVWLVLKLQLLDTNFHLFASQLKNS